MSIRGSFVPPAELRELCLLARQRQKLVGQLKDLHGAWMRCFDKKLTAKTWKRTSRFLLDHCIVCADILLHRCS